MRWQAPPFSRQPFSYVHRRMPTARGNCVLGDMHASLTHACDAHFELIHVGLLFWQLSAALVPSSAGVVDQLFTAELTPLHNINTYAYTSGNISSEASVERAQTSSLRGPEDLTKRINAFTLTLPRLPPIDRKSVV